VGLDDTTSTVASKSGKVFRVPRCLTLSPCVDAQIGVGRSAQNVLWIKDVCSDDTAAPVQGLGKLPADSEDAEGGIVQCGAGSSRQAAKALVGRC